MIRRKLVGLSATVALLAFTPTASEAAIEQWTYQIEPGGTYVYKTSRPGIPGGQPSPFQLDFGLSGTFDVEYDDIAATAVLRNMQLALTGNEAIQMNPPGLQPVTADLVEDWLEARIFENLFVGAPWDQYQSDEFADLYFFDFLNDSARLEGGFDDTPVDGRAMQFNANAHIVLVPEPAGMALAGLATMVFFTLWAGRVNGRSA